MTSAYLASQLVQTVAADLPAHARFAIADGGQALGASDPPPSSGRQQPVAVANRVWTLSMQDAAGVSYGGTWVVALVGAGLLGLLGVVFVRGARYDRRLRDTAAALTGLADLSRALALAGDLRGVGVGLREQLPGLAGVAESSLWEVGEQGTLAPVEPPTPSSALALTFGGLTLDRSIPLTTTLLAGQPVLVTDAHTLARQAPRALAAGAESGGTRSVAFLPLAVRSRITAILVLGWSQPQRFGANQRATLANVSELADRVLERIDDAARTTAGQAALASLGQALDEATSQAEVVETIFDRARPIVGASYANVALVSADGATLVLQRRSTLPGDLPGRYATVPMTDHIPLTDSVRSGQAVLVQDRAELMARYPALVEDASVADFTALAALPLPGPAGRPIGVVGFAWDHAVPFRPTLQANLTTVASLVTQALLRARLTDDERLATHRSERVAALVEAAAAAPTTELVAEAVVAEAVGVVEAASADLGLLENGSLQMHHAGVVPARSDRRSEHPLDQDLPHVHAAVVGPDRPARRPERLQAAVPPSRRRDGGRRSRSQHAPCRYGAPSGASSGS